MCSSVEVSRPVPTAPLAEATDSRDIDELHPPAYSLEDPNPILPPSYSEGNVNSDATITAQSGATKDEDLPELVLSSFLEETAETHTSFIDALPRPLVDFAVKVTSFFQNVYLFLKLGIVLLLKSMFYRVDREGYSKLSLDQVQNHIAQAESCFQSSTALTEEVKRNNYHLVLCARYLCDPLIELPKDDRMRLLERLTSVLDMVARDDKRKDSRERLMHNLMQVSWDTWDAIGEEAEIEGKVVELRAKIFSYSDQVPDSLRDSCTRTMEYFTQKFHAGRPKDRQRLFELLWTHDKGSFSRKDKKWVQSSTISVSEWIGLMKEAREHQCPLKFMQNISYVLGIMDWNQTDISFWIGQVNGSRNTVLQTLFELPQKAQHKVIPQLAKDITFWVQDSKEMILKQLRITLEEPQLDYLNYEWLIKLALQAACQIDAAQNSFLVR